MHETVDITSHAHASSKLLSEPILTAGEQFTDCPLFGELVWMMPIEILVGQSSPSYFATTPLFFCDAHGTVGHTQLGLARAFPP